MKRSEETKQIKEYIEAIELLDAARTFRLLDLKAIQNLAEHTSLSDIKRVYHELKKDLEKIAYYPAQNPDFRNIAKKYALLKIFASSAGVFLMSSVMMFSFFPSLLRDIPSEAKLLYFALLLLCIIIINLAIITGYKMKKMYVRIYMQKSFSVKEARIKKATQFLINRLIEHAEALGEDLKKYSVRLIHDDYENIEKILVKANK